MYVLFYRGIAITRSRRRERLSMFVADIGYTPAQQRDLDILYIPDDLETLE